MSNTENPYILFGGDFVPSSEVRIKSEGRNLYCEKISETIKGAEQFFVNLESPLTDSTSEIYKSGPSLKSDISVANIFHNLGLTGVFLANNHMMDFSTKGLISTINACKNVNIHTVGAGDNIASAREPLFLNVGGNVRVGIINIAENEFGAATDVAAGIHGLDITENIKTIRAAKQKCDILILSLHAGIEYFPLPRPELRKLCRFLVEQEGVDAIVCHHTHIASAYEDIDGRPIFYGIGNFIFNTADVSTSWAEGFLVKLVVDVNSKHISAWDIIPYSQNMKESGVIALQGIKLDAFNAALDRLNDTLKDVGRYAQSWRSFCLSRMDEYMTILYFPFIQWPIRLLKKIPFLFYFIHPKFRRAMRLNLLRCESHLEVIKYIHEDLYINAEKKD